MKGKNGVKSADFIRETINTKISEKPVKSRIFEDFEGMKMPPWFDSGQGCQKYSRKA